jgi:hypothetical protein
MAEERACDRAALKIQDLLFGLPAYHPLQKDAAANLELMKKTFDSFSHEFRRMTSLEMQGLETYNQYGGVVFVADFRPLARVATADDVKAGKAIFHLEGKAAPSKLALPAVAVLAPSAARTRHSRSTARALIVQAEIDADGKTVYGIVGDGPPRAAKSGEVTSVEPLKKPAPGLFNFF